MLQLSHIEGQSRLLILTNCSIDALALLHDGESGMQDDSGRQQALLFWQFINQCEFLKLVFDSFDSTE